MLHLTGFRKAGMSHNCVTSVECQKIHKKSRKFPVIFELILNWTDGQRTIIERPYIAVFDFVNILKRNYPDSCIPELKDAKWFESLWKARKEDKKKSLDEFFQKILSLPESIANGKEVSDFFAFPWRRDSEAVQCKSEEIGTRLQSTAVFSHAEREYESIDFEKTEYSILSIKPKSIAIFPNMAPNPNDTNSTYWAVTEYSKRKSGEVDLMVGAAVSVIQRELSGWWFVYVEGSNEQGWAPAACLLPDDRTNLQDCKITAPCGDFQALKDFEATEADEVSCKKGEKIEVIQASLDGWWKVRCGDRVGILPATNLEPLSNQTKLRTSLYHQIGIYKKDSPPPRRNSKIPVEELYCKVDKFRKNAHQISSSPESTYDNRKPDCIEIPLAPRQQQDETQKMDICTDDDADDDDDDDGQHFYINDSGDSAKHSYVNVDLEPRRNATDGVKYYRSVARLEPKTNHPDRPTLVADVGDIIESHFEETDEVYGKLYQLADGSFPDPKEGWISKLRLELYELGSKDVVEAGLHSHAPLPSNGIIKRPVPAKRVKEVSPVAIPDTKPVQEPVQLPNAKTEASISAQPTDSCTEIAVPEKHRIHQMSRTECEDILLGSAKNCQFILRESTKSGHFALSVRSVSRVHHFPIELTAEKKYFIGRYNFDSLEEVISYYSENPLFELEGGTKVKLGTSLECF